MKATLDFSMGSVWWRAGQVARAFGWPAGAALLLLTLCACFVFLVREPLQQRVVTLKKDAAALRLVPKAKLTTDKALNPADQLAEFYRFFPSEETASDWMEKLYAAAALQGLNLEQGDYQLVHDPDGKITRYDIVLPVRGGYLQIRKFIALVLMEVPALSLDSITFSRQKIGDAAIDAQLRFTLYLVRQ